MQSIFAKIARKASRFTGNPKWVFRGKISVAAILLTTLIATIRLEAMALAFQSARLPFMIAALFLLIPNIFIQMMKWRYLLKLTGENISFTVAYKSLMIGFPLGFLTPGRIGEIGRIFYLQNLERRKTLKLLLFDKLSNMVVTLLFGFAGFLYLQSSPYPVTSSTLLALSSLGFFWSTHSRKARQWCQKFLHLPALSSKNILVIASYSVTFYFIFMAQFILLITGFYSLNLIEGVAGGASTFFLKTLLPLSFGDLGVREAASVFSLAKTGVPNAVAINASLLLFCINVIVPAMLGLPELLGAKKSA